MININPTQVQQGTYQKHGLRPSDREPNDYLRMVSATFSSFRNTPTNDTVVSYINGFEITYNDATAVQTLNYLPTNVQYNIFTINKGVCILDNQLIDIFEDTIFYFTLGDLTPSTKYAIVIEYAYVNQAGDNIAEYKFYHYNDLIFPNANDLSVASCSYVDTTLNGTYSVSDFGGKPGLVIATFSTDINGNVIQSDLSPMGDVLPGIDPQYLSKLYMQNYQLLFEYFGIQALSVFSSMNLTNANFFSINQDMISTDSLVGLKSGDMCYFNPDTCKYEKSLASQQKFSKIIGLYLNEYQEGNHLIYTNGFITIDGTKFNLDPTHTLLNMIPGTHYYLEDNGNIFDTAAPVQTIDGYTYIDGSGRITPAFYPGCVRVGYSTATNQIVLDIDHSLEIGTGNLLDLFGNYDEYAAEYDANVNSAKLGNSITYLTNQNTDLNTTITTYTNYLGVSNAASVIAFCSTNYAASGSEFSTFMYDYINYIFSNGSSADKLSATVNTNVNITYGGSLDTTSLLASLKLFNSFYDIKTLIQLSINNLQQSITTYQNNSPEYINASYSAYSAIINNKLIIARLELGDDPTIIENFENPLIDTTIDPGNYNYSSAVASLQSTNTNLINSNNANTGSVLNTVNTVGTLNSYISQLNQYLIIITNLITQSQSTISTAQNNISLNNINITNFGTAKTACDALVLTSEILKLDIFLMDEHQRNIFNYTYITDRLRRRLLYVAQMSTDLAQAQTNLQTVNNNAQSTLMDQLAAQQNVTTIQNAIAQNNSLINSYTTEYNIIRTTVFGLAPIAYNDENFDDAGLSDQRIGTYRYGCDTDTSYNGLASNFITPCPCVSSSDLTTIDNIGTIIDFQSELTTTAYNVLDPTNLLYGTLSDFESELV